MIFVVFFFCFLFFCCFFFFQAEDGIRDLVRSRGLGDVYKRQVRFYHLGLVNQQISLPFNLILGDRAGEEYREVGDDVAAAADFIEVARADVITVLIDGQRLASNAQRHNVRNEPVSYTHLTLPTRDLV